MFGTTSFQLNLYLNAGIYHFSCPSWEAEISVMDVCWLLVEAVRLKSKEMREQCKCNYQSSEYLHTHFFNVFFIFILFFLLMGV